VKVNPELVQKNPWKAKHSVNEPDDV